MAETTARLIYTIKCKECGADLGDETDTDHDRDGDVIFIVNPCSACIGRADDKADTEGYERGLQDGRDDS